MYLPNEPQRPKTSSGAYALSEDSDQTAHSCSLIRIFTGAFWIANDTKILQADNEDSDQTAWLC